jgi:transcriptional regulator with XRE-family HTH domain
LYIETFTQKLVAARKDTGFTQKEIARELNIPRSTLANYETGRTQPDLETLAKLADFYEVSIDWLLGTKGENKA